jgi:hypothetical protein
MGALRSLLPNVNGPAALRRNSIYYEVWESVVLYAAPVCAKAVKIKKNKNIFKRAQ